jgi:benzil reductase ((S)-benzoin forming)
MRYFIITGASKGLGEGIAMALINENHHLLCISRSESVPLTRMADAKNCRITFFHFDLAVSHDIPVLCQRVFSKIDTADAEGIYLVNNAGVIEPVGRIESCDPAQVENHIRVNLLAPMLLTAEFLNAFKGIDAQKRILNISSGAAKFPYYGWSSYCSSKAAMDMHSLCVDTEQKDETYPAEVMAVAPGIIDTDMQTTIRATSEEQFIHKKKFVEYKETGKLIPANLAGLKLAELLLSDKFTSGKVIDLRD